METQMSNITAASNRTAKRLGGALLALLALSLTACGGGYDRQEAIDDLIDGGLDEATAECVVDGMEEEFGEDKLGSNDDPTDEELAIIEDISLDCVFGGGGDSSSTDETSGADSSGSDSGAEAASGSEQPASLFSSLDLEPVCRGIGIEAAAAYAAGDGPNLVTALQGVDPSYDSSVSILVDGWEPEFGAYETTELVACLNRTSATPVELCEGYEDEDSGLAWGVQTHSAEYEVTLREAKTGTVVDSTTMSAEAGSCPMFSTYFEGEPNPVLDYATPNDELEAWLAGWVNG